MTKIKLELVPLSLGTTSDLPTTALPMTEFSALVDGDMKKVGDLSLEEMEDEEVALVDSVFEGAFGALGDES
ncbi:hypothetical protein Tco_0702145 [Tanacetum coccineum]|uniref:Uncharacterized protein n=1 Tax=Tanacetum coccineum TaxID=301880 RepID=A0ABQ4XV59_9ASTR